MKTKILFAFYCLFMLNSMGQQVHIELDQALPGNASHHYIASESIKLLPNYFYKPDVGTSNFFLGQIDEDQVFSADYQENGITRVGHTKYHDEAIKGVNLNDDRIALDG